MGDPRLKATQHSRKGSSYHSKAPTAGQASSRELHRRYLNLSSQQAQAITVSIFQVHKPRLGRLNNLLRDAQLGSWGVCQA